MSLIGTLDIATREQLVDAATDAAAAPGATALTIRMSDVTFMDSSGIGALISIFNDARRGEIAFRLEQPSDRVRRVLELTGLLDTWTAQPMSPSSGAPPVRRNARSGQPPTS